MNERDGTGAGGQPARFSPLKMVARALSALQGAAEPDAAEVAPARPLSHAVQPILSATDLTEPRAETPAAPVASGESLLAIMNAMLEPGDDLALGPDENEFDLVTLLSAAHEAFGPDAAGQGVTLALAVAPDTAGAYRGDALGLRHALFNLISGGLKATTDDGLELTAGWDGAALMLNLTSAEAAAVMTRVLAKDEQPSPRRPAAHRLGLARTAALALGGAVRVTAGDGVEMSVPLRRVAVAAQPMAAVEHNETAFAPEPTSLSGLRVLVAEPNPAHQQVLTTLLAGMGVEAVVVSGGQDVVDAWREQSWDALVLDIESEAICGPAVARSIRVAETVARWSRMPILALATGAKPRDLDAAFDGLVAKPVHAASLYEALEIALNAERTIPELKIFKTA